MNKIGFIGLGVMGAPMAANLLRKGYLVTVYNRSAGKSDELAALGAEVVATAADAVRGAEVVITMISNDDAIREVYYGASGIIDALAPGTIVMDSSTISPSLARTLATDIAAKHSDFLDAPVTGSKPAAESGTLVFMIGGEERVLEQTRDVIMAMARKIIYMGPSGSGQTAKLAHNTMVGIHAAAFAEGLAIASNGGIEAASFLELVQAGAANSRFAELKTPKLLERDFSVQFSLSLMLKDLRLSSALSDSLRTPTPVLEAVKSVFQVGESMGLGDLDMAALVNCYEEWTHKRFSDYTPQASEAAIAAVEPAVSDSEDDKSDRRKSERLSLHIPLKLSVYQWEQEGSFSGQLIDGVLLDISGHGVQISSDQPLETDMFIVIHFPQASQLPPVTGRIIRIETNGTQFRYGCLLAGLAPYQRLQLEEYIKRQNVTAD
ncbi:3-hydroxyisobutyrate dehydrogenase-like beta-hydroxyacid dehydrogenase [Paenibacillus phyllosphaerae]|uniref:3-hydroxyisobutyrate dehydrogenase-like beta-hydroxyacid dehydrogenase n=1 Tax=Paenibacillus phyllosphaerae TaxID=274593 RepID=A0A7W5B2B7_9BACL|nr:3-hydroxyisobutyrate dehydrogenase-like beta-hydroxyacid dehydrogenase [Paenibacillus phyllosphaerae]